MVNVDIQCANIILVSFTLSFDLLNWTKLFYYSYKNATCNPELFLKSLIVFIMYQNSGKLIRETFGHVKNS